jgi:hypothetical protein
MKALSLRQPWANLIANGLKTIETRKWKTNYRGDLVICSSKNPNIFPAGYAICIVEVYDCIPMIKEHEEKACIKIYPNAWSWFIRNVRLINPMFPVKGKLSFFEVNVPKESIREFKK